MVLGGEVGDPTGRFKKYIYLKLQTKFKVVAFPCELYVILCTEK